MSAFILQRLRKLPAGTALTRAILEFLAYRPLNWLEKTAIYRLWPSQRMSTGMASARNKEAQAIHFCRRVRKARYRPVKTLRIRAMDMSTTRTLKDFVE